MIKNVLAEEYNLSTLISLLFIRGEKKVFLTDFIEYYPNNSNTKNIWIDIGKVLFGSKHLVRYPCYRENFEKNANLLWEANEQALQYISQDHEKFGGTVFGKYLYSIVKDEMIFIAYKKLIQEKITRKILFLNCIAEFEKNKGRIYKLFPEGEISKDLLSFLKIDIRSELCSKTKYWTDFLLQRATCFFYIIISPYLVRDIFKRKVCIKTPREKEYFLGIHVANGVKSGSDFSDTKLLDQGKIEYEKSLFVFSFWQYSKKEMQRFFNEIKEKNSHYCHESSNPIPIRILFNLYLKNYFISLLLLRHCFSGKKTTTLWSIIYIQKIIAHFFSQMVFCKYFKVKIFYSRDDYAFTHIIRTIVQNIYNLKNVGLQHSSFLYPKYIPQSAFTYFDIYFTGGEKFETLWNPYWNKNKKIIPVGHKATTLVKNAMFDDNVKSRFKKKYNSKVTILFLITAHNDSISPFWLLKARYAEIYRVFEIHQDIHLILRPRRADATSSFISICPEIKHYLNIGRCSIEDGDFTTQELISCVDVLVSEDASSSLLESLCRKDLFSFYYMVRYGEFLPQKGLVVNNGVEFYQMIKSYINKDSRYESTQVVRDQLRVNYTMGDDEDCMLKIAKNLKLLE